jgi:hypothetical protein
VYFNQLKFGKFLKMNCDSFSFLDDEDFGLAKSFSKAPFCSIAPGFNYAQKEQADIENEYSNHICTDYVTDGFCFKLSPGEDVSHLTKNVKLYKNSK